MKTRDQILEKIEQLVTTRRTVLIYVERLKTLESERLDAQIEALQWVIDTSS